MSGHNSCMHVGECSLVGAIDVHARWLEEHVGILQDGFLANGAGRTCGAVGAQLFH